MTTITQVSIGVDISKNYLDIHIYPIDKTLRIKNNTREIKKFIGTIAELNVNQIVFESSGGYEFLLKKLLEQAFYTPWIIDPKRIRSFRFSEGIKVKTDACDAKVIALFASTKQQSYTKFLVPHEQEKFRSYVSRRQNLVEMMAVEKKRLNHPQQEYCRNEITQVIEFLKKQVAQVNAKIETLIKANEEWSKRADIIKSVPGVGAVTAAALLAHMPELGHISGKEAAALLGVAPYNNESGQFKGKAFIRDGRSLPRHAMYMAALTAAHSNPTITKFYRRLISVGKKPKVALVAVMRKLIVILNVMLTKSQYWQVA